MDLTDYDIVDLSMSRLDGVKEITFKDMAKVNMSKTDAHPKKLDVSMCDEIRFTYAKLRGVEELIFRDAEQMKRSHIDTALIDGVNIQSQNGDKLDISQITRRENSEINQDSDKNRNADVFHRVEKENAIDLSYKKSDEISGKLDLTEYDEVNMYLSDLRNVKEIIFKEGANVDMSETLIGAQKIDVSKCQDVLFAHADLSGVKELIFKDEEQMKGSLIDTAKTNGVKIKIAGKDVDVASLAIARAKARGGK